MTPSVDVVIVTYNSRDHIRACLDSVAASDFDGTLHTIVVDNASADATAAAVKDHPAVERLIENRRNLGFAAACNQAIHATAGDFVLLLNPDARLQPTTLRRLLDYVAAHPRIGIVGPRLLQADGTLQRDISATGLFPSFPQALFEYTCLGRIAPRARWYRDYFLVGWDRLSNRRVAMVQGACFLVRRPLLQQVGGLEERFFLYFEETDLCKTAADAGWETHYVGDAAAIHIGSQSMDGRRASARHFIASMYRFHRKHYGPIEATALWLVLMPYHGARALRLALLRLLRRRDATLRADLCTARERFAAHWWLLAAPHHTPQPAETHARVVDAWTR